LSVTDAAAAVADGGQVQGKSLVMSSLLATTVRQCTACVRLPNEGWVLDGVVHEVVDNVRLLLFSWYGVQANDSPAILKIHSKLWKIVKSFVRPRNRFKIRRTKYLKATVRLSIAARSQYALPHTLSSQA